jgi:uncharacterized membrane protein (DUF4010 family)
MAATSPPIRTTLAAVEPFEPHLSLATALAVGLLIGLEREQSKASSGSAPIGGIRTYPIFALIGAVSMLLAPASGWMPLIALGGVVVFVGIAYASDVRKGTDHGLTTEVSVVATYLLGALATSRVVEPYKDRLLLVVMLGVVLTFLLTSKEWLHGKVSKVSREDLFASLKFLIAAVVILPLLPRDSMGPLDAINPFSVGLMVVLISGLSFAGFVAMRLLGTGRGLLVSAAVGGLVSSTATTISFANRTKENPAMAPAAAGAIAIASTIMLFRVGVLVAITNPALLGDLLVPLGGAILGAVIGGVLVFRKSTDHGSNAVEVKNPFDLGNAIRFGLVFAVVLLATKAAKHYLGNEGLYLASLVAGLTDVDAVTLSAARNAGSELSSATIAILIAVAANTVVKTGLGAGIGGKALGVRAGIVGGLIIVGAALGAVATVALS